jgi:cytochrome c5
MQLTVKRALFRGLLCVAAIISVSSCSDDQSKPEVPSFEAVDLQQGRAVWMQVCRNCHLMGVAGAPAISDYAAWQPRLAKERDSLYNNAVRGIGDDGVWAMPPRGGDQTLSDDEVRRAVDFMIAAVETLSDR